MRSKRITTSWITLLSPWPVCRIAVMLGGGMTITYGSRADSTCAVNTPRSSQRWYNGGSGAGGSCGGAPELRRAWERILVGGEGRGKAGDGGNPRPPAPFRALPIIRNA